MQIWPDYRPYFVGRVEGIDLYSAFILPDLIGCFVFASFTAWLLHKESQAASIFAWIIAGGQGYAFLLTCWLTSHDPVSYWGLLAMAFSAGTSLMFAARLSRTAILWGPFQFKEAAPATEKVYWLKSLGQTCLMWMAFLVVLPLALAAAEIYLKWDQNWIQVPWLDYSAVVIFVGGGGFGLWAGKAMTLEGKGTPLPSQAAKRLVLGGPYRIVRNPMAVGGILQGMAVGLSIGSPLVILYSLMGGIAWNTLVRPLEEEYLEGVFGNSYLEYKNSVRCWLPKLR